MSRTLPSATVGRMNAAQTSSAFLTLIEITHSSFSTVRLVNNTVNVVSNSQTFTAFPFVAILPPDTDQVNVVGRLSVPNATRELVSEVRSVSGSRERVLVDVHIIDSADPNTYLRSETGLEVVNVVYNADVMTADLSRDSLLNEPWPGDRMSPATFPGIF